MKLCNYLIILILTSCAFFLGGCHSSKMKIPYPKSSSDEPYLVIDKSHLSSDRQKIIEESYRWMGTPYKYGGNTKEEGIDCSGFVLQAYLNSINLKLPRSSREQSAFCYRITSKEIKPGDLAFFATGKDPNKVSHVAIMLDDDNFIHSSSSKGVVISQLSLPYWTRTFIHFGRIPGIK